MTHYNGTKRFPKIKKINTKILISIVEADGRTDTGSDYGPLLEEIKEELMRRQAAQAERTLRTQERELAQKDTHVFGKQCPRCLKHYPVESIEENFYKVANQPHRYRPRCKACHIEAARTARIKNLPF